MSKYNPEKHIPLLTKSMESLRDIGEFCHQADINKSTFFEWVKTYPEFKEAYERANSYAQTQWECLPLTKPNLNIVYWTAIMRNRFKYYSKLPKLKGKSIKEKLEAYEDAGEKGEITPEQYMKLVNNLSDELKIRESSKDFLSDSALSPEQKREETEALVQFFVSKGFSSSEAANMIINFAEGSQFLSERRLKNVQQ